MPIYLYLIPCLYYTFHKTFGRFFFWLFVEKLGRSADCFLYTDNSFCGDEALGEEEDTDGVEWKRVHEINPDVPFKDLMLFGAEIDADDIAQGGLGDCWLLSGIACLAEFPGAVQSVFSTRECSYRGKYTVRLWSNFDEKFVNVTVDDKIPCVQNGDGWAPKYCNFNPTKPDCFWALILEKAFAKYNGSYKSLDGGFSLYAMQAMTGDRCISYGINDGKWTPSSIKPGTGTEDNKREFDWTRVKSDGPDLTNEEMFDVLLELDRKDAVMGAGTKSDVAGDGRADTKEDSTQGIVQVPYASTGTGMYEHALYIEDHRR
jgi:hypothetical protein